MTELSIDFSQSGEQAVIVGLFEELGITQGTFLDIGAGDGRTLSNTVALASMGWGGVCVEPAPWASDRLSWLYREQPNVEVVQAVVTAEVRGLVNLYYSRGDHLSTVEVKEARKWQGQVEFEVIATPAVTLSDIIERYRGPFEFVSIDAEGRTNELVRALSRTDVWERIEVICFEREDFARGGGITLAPPWELVTTTANNVIYRRSSSEPRCVA